jgi:hypothetical protein
MAKTGKRARPTTTTTTSGDNDSSISRASSDSDEADEEVEELASPRPAKTVAFHFHISSITDEVKEKVAEAIFSSRELLFFPNHGDTDGPRLALGAALFAPTGPLGDNGKWKKPRARKAGNSNDPAMISFVKTIVQELVIKGTAVGDHGGGQKATAVEELTKLEELAVSYVRYGTEEGERRLSETQLTAAKAQALVKKGESVVSILQASAATSNPEPSLTPGAASTIVANSNSVVDASKRSMPATPRVKSPTFAQEIASSFAPFMNSAPGFPHQTSFATQGPPPPAVPAGPPATAQTRGEIVNQLAELRNLMDDPYVGADEKEGFLERMKELRAQLAGLQIA